MYEITVYETADGNRPLDKLFKELQKKHRKNDIDAIQLHIRYLQTYGPDINKNVKSDLVKPVQDGVFELRIKANRVLFFYYMGKKIVLLHGFIKKRNNIPTKERNLAIVEMKDYLRRNQS